MLFFFLKVCRHRFLQAPGDLFFEREASSPMYTLRELADYLGGVLGGPPELVVRSVGSLEEPGTEAIVFIEEARQAPRVAACGAVAAVVPPGVELELPCIQLASPRWGFARLLELFHPARPVRPGVHPTACAQGAEVSPEAEVGPFCSLGPGVRVEAGARLVSRVAVGAGSRIGPGCLVQPGVVMGAGCQLAGECVIDPWVRLEDGVVLGERVYLGTRCLIGREASIGEGSKLDNMVLVQERAQLGKHCILVAQGLVLAGARLGDYCVLAAQGVVSEGVELAFGVQVSGRSMVYADVTEKGAVLGGDPAHPIKRELKERAERLRAGEVVEWARRHQQKKETP